MEFKLSKLKTGINRWEETFDPVDLELNPREFPHKSTVNFTVEKLIGKINVKVDVETSGNFICDRCAEEFELKINGNCSVRYIKRDSPFPDECPGDELRSYAEGQDFIEVTNEVRDALLLFLPMKFLCSEDCKGICPKCGANLNLEKCKCSIDGVESEG